MTPTRFFTQQSWGWRVAAYLFLASLGSGSTLAGVVFGLLFEEQTHMANVGVAVGPPLVGLGCLFLLFDLGRPALHRLVPGRPKGSWISRGFFILCAFILLGLAQTALSIWPWGTVDDFRGTWTTLGIINGILALLTSLYPGLLLGTCFSVPFWNTPILPILFLSSSASMGVSTILFWMVHILGMTVFSREVSFLLHAEAFFIVLEMFLILLYFQGMKSPVAAKISVMNITVGRFAPLFWGGLVFVGLVIPLFWGWFGRWTLLSTLCIFFGGYLLRYLVIKGGVKIPLSAQGVILPIPGKH